MHDNRIAVNQETVENILNDRNHSVYPSEGLIAANLNKINALNESKLTENYREPNFIDREPLSRRSEEFDMLSSRSHHNTDRSANYHQNPLLSPSRTIDENRLKELNLSPKSRHSNVSAYSNIIPQVSFQSPTKHEKRTVEFAENEKFHQPERDHNE